MRTRNVDEGPAAPMLARGGPAKILRGSPLSLRRAAWFVRRKPGLARKLGLYIIWPDGRSNILRGGAK